jgi:tRNA threonylcarbamoyladenosine biosynthesis protein TsaE
MADKIKIVKSKFIKLKYNLDQIDQIAREQIISLMKKYSIFTFTGPLGVGKTTLIKSVLRQVGVSGPVTSPTFGYVNSYHVDSGVISDAIAGVSTNKVYNHFDLYRIATIDEFINLGFDEYLAAKNSINFIEWPNVIESLISNPELRSKVCDIKIDYISDDISSRVIQILTRV